MTAPDSAIAANLRDAFAIYSRACGERVEGFPGVTCVRHPSRSSGFNLAFLGGGEGVESNVLRRVQGFFREIGTEWCFVVPPSLAGLFGPTTKRVRISARRAVPEMVLNPAEVSIPPPPKGLEVRTVETVDGLRTWARTSWLGFGEGRRNLFRFMANRRSLEPGGFTCHLGWASGRAVATSVSYSSDGVTVILGVSTLPRASGRGYGEAVTWAAVRDGITNGSDTVSLQASPLGFPIYHRMGFRRIFDFEEWVVPKDAPDARA